VLRALAARLGADEPDTTLVPDRVQVLTMHSAKGLSAQVVFIPGLEEPILPGDKRRPYPGLVLEAARMLYVSITRAPVGCWLSHAWGRIVHYEWRGQPASQFAASARFAA
jgi:DNA helicase II / ATP-dependent DNA helicase PcrA